MEHLLTRAPEAELRRQASTVLDLATLFEYARFRREHATAWR
jgi:hypothetical protein